jgi:hypothetical protein
MISPKHNKIKKSKEIKEIEENIKFILQCMNTLTDVIKSDQQTIQHLLARFEELDSSSANEMMYR